MKFFNKATTIVLIALLSISLIWTLIFWLTEMTILNNPVTDKLWSIYWDVYPVWISVVVALFNVLCAIIRIQPIFKKRESDKKLFRKYLIYASLSIAILVIHCITSNYILGCVITSV